MTVIVSKLALPQEDWDVVFHTLSYTAGQLAHRDIKLSNVVKRVYNKLAYQVQGKEPLNISEPD